MITVSGIEGQREKLQKIISTSPGMEKRINEVIRKTLKEVRDKLSANAKSGLQMKSDPRNAYKAVRFAVYRRIFGGQVNILNSRKKSKGAFYAPPRKDRDTKRGGNRRKRSDRTIDMMSYNGNARGFVLRFLNAGTKVRYAGYGRNGRTDEENQIFALSTGGMGHRGSIQARNWFGSASQKQLEAAVTNIQKMIDQIINEEFL